MPKVKLFTIDTYMEAELKALAELQQKYGAQ
jgi:hypothetical protein